MTTSMFGFGFIVSTGLLFMWIYLWRSFVRPFEPNKKNKIFIFFIFSFIYLIQISRWIFFSKQQGFVLSFSLNFGYLTLGLLSHLFLGALLKDFIFFVFKPVFSEKKIISGFILICFLANAVGMHTALSGPEVKQVFLEANIHYDSSKNLKNFSIVQISDLHIGPFIGHDYVEKVVQKVNALNPDLIAITGDLADGVPALMSEDLALLKKLKSKYGVFYVSGNHEFYWNIDEWMMTLQKLGITTLENESKWIEYQGQNILIAGLPDITGLKSLNIKHHPDFEKIFEISQTNGDKNIETDNFYKILLAHQPNTTKYVSSEKFNLMLSGHTHHGQFFPMNFAVGFFNTYTKGLNQVGSKAWIYVNAGTGFWGPPLRLGVPSEITQLIFR